MRSALAIAVFFVFLFPSVAAAQFLGGSTEAFSVSITPQYPTPHSHATLSVLSSSLDLAGSTLVVSVGGKEIYKGGVRPVSFSLGRPGNVSNIRVTILSGESSYSQSLSVQPQDILLVAEPISSAPPLYPGKPSVPIGGSVRIVAMTDMRTATGKWIDPNTLSYSWAVDGVAFINSSGIGKRVLIVDSPLEYRGRAVSIAVSSVDGVLSGGAELSLSSKQPAIRLYENDPLLGIRFCKAISGEHAIYGPESSLYAAAFSFPMTNGTPPIEWFLNGASVQTGNAITLRPTGSGQGRASLSAVATVEDSTKVSENISLIFGSESDFNLFGL